MHFLKSKVCYNEEDARAEIERRKGLLPTWIHTTDCIGTELHINSYTVNDYIKRVRGEVLGGNWSC